MEDRELFEKRPAIVIVGPPSVGKRTLISRLLKVDFDDDADQSAGLSIQGWTIDTKYYKADVSIWMIHLSDEFKVASLPVIDQVAALVMVFDVNDLTSFIALKDWVSHNDIQRFDILMCIGNKVDLVHGHPAHGEYKRRLLKHGESSSTNSYTEFLDYGISETEGSSLLGDEESSWDDAKRSCLEWCLDHNIEYVEACASNPDFDKCLSVDGDSQGVERLYGALSANMWPGMILKSGDKINEPSLPEQQESSEEEESDYEPDYEILSSGSAEPFDDVRWISANDPIDTTGIVIQSEREFDNLDRDFGSASVEDENHPSTSVSQLPEELDQQGRTDETTHETKETSDSDEDKAYDFEDLEKLMAEIGNVRNGLRLMPDFQRREMAAKLAMKMASMFGDSSDGEAGFD